MTIKNCAKTRGVTIGKRIVVEESISNVKDQRSRSLELWQRIKGKRIGTIIITKLSRLSQRIRTLVNFLYSMF